MFVIINFHFNAFINSNTWVEKPSHVGLKEHVKDVVISR